MDLRLGTNKACSSFHLSNQVTAALVLLGSEVEFPALSEIFRQGDACKGVYILMSGHARICIATDSGKEIFARLLTPGCILGLPATLCNHSYNFTATALVDSRAIFIQTDRILQFLREQPQYCMEIVRMMSQELTEMNQARTNLHVCGTSGCSLYSTCVSEMKV